MACAIKKNSERISLSSIGPELFLFSPTIVCNYTISSGKDVGTTTIVLLKRYDTCISIVSLELKNVSNTCSAPAIDCLIGVTSYG